MSFTNLHIHADLLKGIRELGFTRPTPIQAEAVPPALEGRDLLACAQTGSGKTIAFLLPILHRLMNKPRRTTRALILTPTRELAAQILEEFNGLTVHTPLTGAAVFGGVSMGPQEHAFRSGVDLIVATPGRLLDHATRPYAKLSGLEYLVLDEADRMLDMGFLPDIKRILRHIPGKRQTLFFSATMPREIAALASEMLKNPATIALQRQSAPAVGITQAAYPVPQPLKSALLVELLKRGIMTQALVFTRTKHRANRLAESLVRSGITAERIHGNRSQAQRTQALAGFKSGRYPVLVATDIAARGIDVEALSHVINFDVPATPDDYIHRVGRTGRAELTGEAFTFVSPDEEQDLRAIERAVGRSLPRVTLPDFNYKAQAAQLEVPLRERIAAIREMKRQERERARANAARRAAGVRKDQGSGIRDQGSGNRDQGPGRRPSSGRFRPRGRRRGPSEFRMARAYRAGESIEDLCRACKTDRIHTVVVVDPTGTPIRVTCDFCHSEHNYRGGPRIDAGAGSTRSAQTAERPPAAASSHRAGFPLVSERERAFAAMTLPETSADLELLLRRIIREEAGVTAVTPAAKWRNGTLVLRPGQPGLQEKSWPIETFFHKVVMLRNRLRTLEQQVNASDLPDDVKVKLQAYVSGCYGTLTSFNVLFADEDDQFKGSGE